MSDLRKVLFLDLCRIGFLILSSKTGWFVFDFSTNM